LVGFFGVIILNEVTDFIAQLPVWWGHLSQQSAQRWPEMKQFFDSHPVGKRLRTALRAQGPMLVEDLEYVVSTTLAAGKRGVYLGMALGPL
jgi:hypothetical protein